MVLRFRSVRSIVIAPAKTGNDSRSNTVVISTAQANKGIESRTIPNARRFPNVLIKLIAPKIEETPAKWSEKIAKSTEPPLCARFLDRGGYTEIWKREHAGTFVNEKSTLDFTDCFHPL